MALTNIWKNWIEMIISKVDYTENTPLVVMYTTVTPVWNGGATCIYRRVDRYFCGHQYAAGVPVLKVYIVIDFSAVIGEEHIIEYYIECILNDSGSQ